MVETLIRRIKSWKDINYSPQLLIIDETHQGNFFKLIDAFPNARCIGATGTPINKKIPAYYTDIVNNIDVMELVEQGFLCKCKGFMMQDDFSDVPVVRGGDYEENALFRHFDKKILYQGVVEKYMEKTPHEKALVFNVSIEHANKMNEEFKNAGIRSEVVTSETPPDERERIFSDFDKGVFPVLNNCGIATVGLDIPSLKVVVMNRATKSLVLWLQCLGRGSRPYPGKTHFTCLDFGNNFIEHGIYEQRREWKLEPPKKKKKAGTAPVKNCIRCSAMLHASVMKCPYCGYIFPRQTQELKNGIMVEVKALLPEKLKGRMMSSLDVRELALLSKSGSVNRPFIWRVLRSKGAPAINEFSKLVGYKNGWAYHQRMDIKNCGFRDRVL